MDRPPLDPRAARLGALGAVSGLIAVAAGAFGAHLMRGRLAPDMVEVWETAARQHLVHALAILAAAWALDRTGRPLAATAGWLFVAGTMLFSGSLYALALSGVHLLGAITPLGGLALLAGWLALANALVARGRTD